MDIENLNNWNLWWNTGNVPDALNGIARTIDLTIFGTLKIREITVLTGIRRAGKTTIMYQMIGFLLKDVKPEQILYVNLDDETLKKESLENIYNLYRQSKNPQNKAYVFLDEIQNIQDWQLFLKKHYDLRDNVKFIISGSSAKLLRGEYATLLTGRNLTFNIYPLSFKEYLKFANVSIEQITATTKNTILHHLNNYLEYGGFPEVFFKESELKRLLLKQYFDDIIYKDIISRHNVTATKINELAIYLLTNMSNAFSYRSIRNFTKLSIDSINDYIAYLEEAYMVVIINYFSYSLKEGSQMPKKCYVIDTGIRNIAGFKFTRDLGRLVENCVAIKLKQENMDVYYWKKKGEVDFVVKEKDQSLTAINVSYTDEIVERETKALLEFKKEFKKTKKMILITKDLEKQEKNITFIPFWKWVLIS